MRLLFIRFLFPNAKLFLMRKTIMSWLIKWFMPKPKALANMAAEAIAKAINESDKTDIIKQYDGYAAKLTELQTFIVKLLEDGKIDDTEKAKIAEMLEPIMTKITEKI